MSVRFGLRSFLAKTIQILHTQIKKHSIIDYSDSRWLQQRSQAPSSLNWRLLALLSHNAFLAGMCRSQSYCSLDVPQPIMLQLVLDTAMWLAAYFLDDRQREALWEFRSVSFAFQKRCFLGMLESLIRNHRHCCLNSLKTTYFKYRSHICRRWQLMHLLEFSGRFECPTSFNQM